MSDHHDPLTARIPADVDMPDKVLANLTIRQVLILAGTGLLVTCGFMTTDGRLPLPMIAVFAFPVIAIGFSMAFIRRDGMSLDRLLLFALDHLRRRKVLVDASEGISAPPSWCRLRGRLPGPLQLPVTAIREDGVMELAEGGTAMIVRAGTVPFGLRTPGEQAALVGSFGRWLNSLDAPIQILVQTRSADLSALAEQMEDAAPRLPHPALERAALEHTAFLHDLSAARELLTRQVLIVIRDNPALRAPLRKGKARQASALMVARHAEETIRRLSAIGITGEVLGTSACVAALSDALSPGRYSTGEGDLDDLITGRRSTQDLPDQEVTR